MNTREKERIFIGIGLLLLMMMAFVPAVPIYAEPSEEYETEKSNAEYYRDEVNKLAARLADANQEIVLCVYDLGISEKELAKIDVEIEETEQTLLRIENRIQAEKEEMDALIQNMYVASRNPDPVAALIYAETRYYTLNHEEYERAVSQYLFDRMENRQQMKNELSEQNAELQDLRNVREEEVLGLEQKRTELALQIENLTVLMRESERRAEDAERFAEELYNQMLEMEARERELLQSQSYNGVSSSVNYSGDGTSYYYETPYPYTDTDLYLLGGIIEAEAGSSSYPGMVAVGSVVLNRVYSQDFSNTIEGVIYAPKQFEPVETGRLALILARGPNQACLDAAREVLEGKRNVPNLYFKAAWYAEEHGIHGVNIGGNVFH